MSVGDNSVFGSCGYNKKIGYPTGLGKSEKIFGAQQWSAFQILDPDNKSNIASIKYGDNISLKARFGQVMAHVPEGWNITSKNYLALGGTEKNGTSGEIFVIEVPGGKPGVPITSSDTINIKARHKNSNLYLSRQTDAKGMTTPCAANVVTQFVGFTPSVSGGKENWKLIKIPT